MPASAVTRAHEILREALNAGDAAVDATAGNGHDTLLLARITAPGGTVFAFDIQPEAIAATARRLDGAGIPQSSRQLFHAGHETMRECIPPHFHGRIAAVVFNLGYLPGGDKSVITVPATTLAALSAALELLRDGGVVVAVLYPGHPGGADEAAAVRSFAAALSLDSWLVTESPPVLSVRPAPSVLRIFKRHRAAQSTFALSLPNPPPTDPPIP